MTHRPPPSGPPPSGLPLTVPIGIPAYWTPEEAIAVFELIDDLREQIWAIYGIQIQQLTRQQRQPAKPARKPRKAHNPA